jgi:PAS domain S-box-containing protein
MDPEEIFTYTNPAFTTLLGYTREELLGMSFNQIVSPEEYPLIEDQKDYHKKGIGTQYETIMIRKDGKSRHVIVSTTPLTSKDGEDEGTQLVIADLTERKLAETKLLESESRYRNLVESAPDGIVSTNKTGKILSVNESFLKLTGYENSDFIGRSFLKIPTLITQDLDFYARVVKDLLQGKITGTIQFNWKHANGEIKKGEAKASIQKVNDKIVGLQAIIRDVTERMQAEEDIQKNISRLDALRNIDQAIMGSLDLDLTLKIILDNLLPQLDVDAAVVLQYQEDIQTLQFSQGLGFKTAALQYTDLRLGHGYAGKVGLQRDHIFIPDLNHEEDKFLDFPQIKKEDFVSYYGVPLNAKGKLVGVLEIFHRSTLNPDDDWVNYLKLLAGQIAIAIDNVTLFNDLQRSNIDLTLAYDATIEGWAHALELKDMETEGHSRRVVSLSLDLAQALGISAEKMVHIRRGALLHDIGKMGVPDAILQKPGKLNDEEWQIMRQHPVYTLDWLYPIEYLRPALEIPYSHHERWDGTGYPRGIKGELIPLAARIFAIVDVWDALTSDRPYRKAWSREKTLAHIKEQSGKHFDPLVVEKFLEILKNDESK